MSMDIGIQEKTNQTCLTDMDKTELPGIEYLQHIMETKIKFVDNVYDDLEVLKELKELRKKIEHKIVFCEKNIINNSNNILSETIRFYNCLVRYLNDYGKHEYIKDLGDVYEIKFLNELDAEICSVSSTSRFKFYKHTLWSSRERLIRIKRHHQGVHNRVNPLDYNTLIIGPLDVDIDTLAIALDSVSPIFGVEKLQTKNYYSVLFQDGSLSKRFIDVVSHIGIQNNSSFSTQFAYENCLITKIPEYFSVPFVCSFIPTRIVFIIDIGFTKQETETLLKDHSYIDIKFSKKNVILIECENKTMSNKIYDTIGGQQYKNEKIVSGYYPEFNYVVGNF